MRPSLANGVQAWLLEAERSGIAPGVCAATGLLAQTANTAPAKSQIALRSNAVLRTDFGATNERIASSLGRFRPNQALFFSRLPDDTRSVELHRDARTALSTAVVFAAPPLQLRSPGASRPVRATYSV